MMIVFWGMKNETQRQGFEVTVPAAEDKIMDPVQCLKVYITKTESLRQGPDYPLLSLKAPYNAITADMIGNILEQSIQLAGLDGFTAKSFRPTGATVAVSQGVIPETVMKVR